MKTTLKPRKGKLVNEGKTKRIFRNENNPLEVVVHSKDDITAGDGRRHDVVPGKGAMSNSTTCNVFRFLRDCGLAVAFKRQLNEREFLADYVNMLPIEIIWRRRAAPKGSIRERIPILPPLHVFPQAIIEMHLKTSGKRWKKNRLPADDPLMKVVGDKVELYHPHLPIHSQKPFLTIPLSEVIGNKDSAVLDQILGLTRQAFLALERAYCLQGFELIDGKIEMGFTLDGRLVIADVIDAESVRLMREGKNYDKQPYRDDGLNPELMERFAEVFKATWSFSVPRQRVIIWTGSVKDDTSKIEQAIGQLSCGTVELFKHTRSTHKETELGLLELRKIVQDCPLAVIIADIGMSNGAGPTLSAHTGVPVITLPKDWKDFPADVWSSLHTPSNVPVSTMLSPNNAVLQALQILALSNPQLYAVLEFELEKRMINTVRI